uniref:Transmembrane protein n=1 Tax=Trichobilharzia regenti TaxID=157069 RepID=A0AA85JCH7_TRIRE|nr:unnamed protein product [Trichobilharzia regenti]CAH8876058.1 unnamed protein product [Trichobilharzia regenti]
MMIYFQVAVILWSLCCVVSFSQISKFSETIYWSWCITIALMWFLDIVLLIRIILMVTGRLTQILGHPDEGRRFSQAVTLGIIVWKLAVQTVLWLYLKESIGGPPYDRYLTYNGVTQFRQNDNNKKPILARHRAVFAVFPFWTTMLICLLAVCSQIVNFGMSSLWACRGNDQPTECHECEEQQDTEFSPEHSSLE